MKKILDDYLNLLGAEARVQIESEAMRLYRAASKGPSGLTDARNAWIEAVLVALLRRGLLRPLDETRQLK